MIATWLLLTLAVLAQPAAATPAEIAAAIGRLGDDEFTVREQATTFLWRAGKAAQADLEAAAKSDDREIATRASEVLEKVRLGILPDTPPEIINLVRSFQSGSIDQKRVVLSQLRQKKQQSTMFVLIRSEADKSLRKQLAREFVTDGRKAAIDLVAAENLEGAEEMLAWSASVDETTRSQRDYAAYLYLTGRMEKKLAQWRAAGEEKTDKDAARLLGVCLLIQGQHREALEVAKLSGDRSLQNDVLYRLEDWAALASEEHLPDGQPVERLAAKAAYWHLAGKQPEFETAVAEILALPQTNEEQGWLSAEALLCIGRWNDASTILRRWDRVSAFQVLANQLKFREAFTLAGVDDPQQAATWYLERAKAIGAKNPDAWQHFNLGLRVSRALRELGEDDAATALLDAVAGAQPDPDLTRSYNVFVEQWRRGSKPAALRRAAILMSNEPKAAIVAQELFGRRGPSVLQWWQVLRERTPGEDPFDTLQHLVAMFDQNRDWPLADVTLAELCAQAEATVARLDAPRRPARLWALAELAIVRDDRTLAIAYLEKHAELDAANVTPVQWIGDLRREQKDWEAAVAAYRKGWERDKSVAIALYMLGYATAQSGKEEEGRRLMQWASLLPLADTIRRHDLAQGLEQRGLAKEAAEQRELAVRFGAAGTWAGNDDWYFRDSARLLGNQIEMQDSLRAASLWDRVLFGVMRTNSFFLERSDYAQMQFAVHKMRARGLVLGGKVEEGLRELDLAIAAKPSDVGVVEQLLPVLMDAGCKDAAEKLFGHAYEVHETVCKEFPKSAMHHNELAWLAARNDRRLEDALTHAQEAVRLKPEATNYLDTLAEVHFRRGDREKALELAHKCAEREPNNKHYEEQVKRFEKQ